MVSSTRAVEINLAEAEILADLYGIAFDLDDAAEFCSKAIELGRPFKHDSALVEGLVIAALVRYFRCFSSGTRLGLRRKDIESLQEQLETHDNLKALRDKFVAHPVNSFEQSYVTASATERDGVKLPIRSIHPGRHRLVLSANEAKALAQLISMVRKIVSARVLDEERRLLEVVQRQPPDSIHGGDLHTVPVLKASDVNRPRKYFRSKATPKH